MHQESIQYISIQEMRKPKHYIATQQMTTQKICCHGYIGLIREFFESHCKVPNAPSIQGLEQTQQLNEQSKYRFYMRNGIVVKKKSCSALRPFSNINFIFVCNLMSSLLESLHSSN
jgi:hypothetical protein